MKGKRISVLVVDDSPVVRQVLSKGLAADPDFGDVYTAPGGELALRKIEMLAPDVVTLDVEMPDIDGLATLEQIMQRFPRPVIMVSAVTQEGAAKTIRALELGAVDFIPKPSGRLSLGVAAIVDDLKEKIRAICSPDYGYQRPSPRRGGESVTGSFGKLPASAAAPVDLIAIGASTGGTDAIRRVLAALPRDFPAGVVIVQHMPPGFTASFAHRLNELCALEVKEATNKDLIKPGRVLLAPGHKHMVVRKEESVGYVELLSTPEVSRHRPSVDVLLESVAESYGSSVLAVLLTGMGRDGAAGMARLRERGAITVAQDAASCVVFGMPRAAIALGAVDFVVPLAAIGDTVRRAADGALDAHCFLQPNPDDFGRASG